MSSSATRNPTGTCKSPRCGIRPASCTPQARPARPRACSSPGGCGTSRTRRWPCSHCAGFEDPRELQPVPSIPCHRQDRGCLLATLLGRRAVLRERFSHATFWDDIRSHGCTAAVCPPPWPPSFIEQPPRPDDADNPLSAVIMGPVIPRSTIQGAVRGNRVHDVRQHRDGRAGGHPSGVDGSNWRSCGCPSRGKIEVAVVDDYDRPVGPSHRRADLSALPAVDSQSRLLAHAGGDAQHGDAGGSTAATASSTTTHGNWYFVDRVKDYIRRRSENISSFEVESAVNAYPGVLESAAVAVPAETAEDEVKVVVQPKPGSSSTPPTSSGSSSPGCHASPFPVRRDRRRAPEDPGDHARPEGQVT